MKMTPVEKAICYLPPSLTCLNLSLFSCLIPKAFERYLEMPWILMPAS